MIKYLLVFLFSVSFAFAQEGFEVSGKITDNTGKIIPFASVYLKNSSISTMANEAGIYKLRLDSGNKTLIFRNVGYKQRELNIDVPPKAPVDITLTEEVFSLPEIAISARSEDRAYPMIREVIANRKYLRENPSYSCEVYTKGVQKLISAPKRILGEDVEKTLQLDSNRRGIIYQSETTSKFYFQYPNVKEVMLASKIAGDRSGFSFNRALDLQVNLYHNLIQWKAWGNQSFVSPVADNAFNFIVTSTWAPAWKMAKKFIRSRFHPRAKPIPHLAAIYIWWQVI